MGFYIRCTGFVPRGQFYVFPRAPPSRIPQGTNPGTYKTGNEMKNGNEEMEMAAPRAVVLPLSSDEVSRGAFMSPSTSSLYDKACKQTKMK